MYFVTILLVQLNSSILRKLLPLIILASVMCNIAITHAFGT